MNNNIEFELKILVNKDQFETLLALFDTQCVDQNNIYYDNENQVLHGKKSAMRLRFIDNKKYFTLKTRSNGDLLEYEKEVFFDDLNNCNDEEINNLLSSFDVYKPFFPIGSLRTIRHYINLEHGQLCFDENYYNGKIDYEIEYEYFDEHDGIRIFNDILSNVGLVYKSNCTSKFRRCMQS